MSTPQNHHYVSQVHIKNFFNYEEGKIYVYDKDRKNHYFKKTTRSLFSERRLNSRFKDGVIDHETIEKDLNDFFEKDFRKNTEIVQAFTNDNRFTEDVRKALIYFVKYGIIGDMRTPRYKKNVDDTIIEALSKISENATASLKNQINDMFKFTENVKYSNLLDYSELADKILGAMGNVIFQIMIPKNEEDFFILPDVAAATTRAKINKYYNPDTEEIAFVSIPLSSKIYIHFHSQKLFQGKKVPDSNIWDCSSKQVAILNKANLGYSQCKIACESEAYLKAFIEHY